MIEKVFSISIFSVLNVQPVIWNGLLVLGLRHPSKMTV